MSAQVLFAQAPDAGNLPQTMIIIVAVIVALVFTIALLLMKCYKLCPSNKVLVKWGVGSGTKSAMPIHGGGAWVLPVVQSYSYLTLEPLQIEVPLKGALSAENIRVNVPSVFTVAIGTDSAAMQNAAIRLLGLQLDEISGQASDIIFGQLRQVIASMRIEEINRDRDKFLESVQSSMEPELEKIGLVLINVNITDITDDSGYIEAIGRKAASGAIQQAEIDVAEKQKMGSIGVARAQQEQAIEVANAERNRDIGTKTAERDRQVQVAELTKEERIGVETSEFEREARVKESQRDMRIQLSSAEAQAIDGENQAKATIAVSNAGLDVKQAEAHQLGESRKRQADAAVFEAQYKAQAQAALAEAEKVEAEQRAKLEAPARAEKAKVTVDAEAEAEKRRIEAEGEAKAIYAKLEAEARGNYEILSKKAQGLGEIVKSCGRAEDAFQLLMLEHMEHLSTTAAQAISNIKFDKVIVWENGGQNGKGATAGFLQNLANTLPPMLQIMQDVGGVKMPEYFGAMIDQNSDAKHVAATAPESSNGGAATVDAEDKTASDPTTRRHRRNKGGNA